MKTGVLSIGVMEPMVKKEGAIALAVLQYSNTPHSLLRSVYIPWPLITRDWKIQWA